MTRVRARRGLAHMRDGVMHREEETTQAGPFYPRTAAQCLDLSGCLAFACAIGEFSCLPPVGPTCRFRGRPLWRIARFVCNSYPPTIGKYAATAPEQNVGWQSGVLEWISKGQVCFCHNVKSGARSAAKDNSSSL